MTDAEYCREMESRGLYALSERARDVRMAQQMADADRDHLALRQLHHEMLQRREWPSNT